MLTSSRSVATLLLTALTGLLFLVTAPAAMAASYNWYSAGDPLNAYDGTLRASAFGTSYQKDGFLKNHTYYRDRRDNGNAVYTETGYRYYVVCTGNTAPSWCAVGSSDQSARTQSGSWQDQYDADDYSTRAADKGRVYSKVCEDQSWSPDACSRQPYFTFNL
ncbi:hypothetical protein BJ993_000888 [Nocardioides aromaticivorans]|uniref:Secreted protein n=1 Tax=Nocardioides aromaticivorans TaxID=200618 RepID=A0A7Y9ZGF7_9ACTN|nr:hypothetical protein [Nocardioides aromaticivorans]NYI43808.1 hypothetical protein [Nocardioides aromaticivorans]